MMVTLEISAELKSVILYLTSLVLMINIGFGQDNIENESFSNLPEGIIKNEVAFFSKKVANSSSKITGAILKEIPLKKCSDSYAFFEKGNVYASEIIVSIESGNSGQITFLKKVLFLHYKYGFSLPDSVINDIHAPVFCTKYTSRGKPIDSNCKVYQSGDKRRIYIYMLNGREDNRYEVTWVVQDDKYYTRIIDNID